MPLTGDLGLFQQTLLRIADPDRYASPIIITNEEYRFLVAEQALECGVDLQAILLEPVARNTAAAIAAASLFASKSGKNQLVHILPSDHDVAVDSVYLSALDVARKAAIAGKLVTFALHQRSQPFALAMLRQGNKKLKVPTLSPGSSKNLN